MVGLLDLPAEIMEQIFHQQEDVGDMISLGSSCSWPHQILSKQKVWRNLLSKAKMTKRIHTEGKQGYGYKVNPPVVQMLMLFLKTVDYPEVLLGLLHKHICLLYPAFPGSSVTVGCSLHSSPHTVSSLGLELLALTGGQSLTIATVHLDKTGTDIIKTLSTLVSMQEAAVTEMNVTGTILCTSEEEGLTLASLLVMCSSWRLGELVLEGAVGREAWEGLGRASSTGRLELARVERQVLKRGEWVDVRMVLKKTTWNWAVEGREQEWYEVHDICNTLLETLKNHFYFTLSAFSSKYSKYSDGPF